MAASEQEPLWDSLQPVIDDGAMRAVLDAMADPARYWEERCAKAEAEVKCLRALLDHEECERRAGR